METTEDEIIQNNAKHFMQCTRKKFLLYGKEWSSKN